MIHTCENIGLKVEVEPVLLDQMYTIAMNHYPREFGGVLVGRYSEDMKTCLVCDIIPAKEYKSEKYYFERGKRGLAMTLKAFYNQEPRLIYIGEWHTHPDMVPEASGTDKEAMKILEQHDDVHITSPLLLIISNNLKTYTYNFYVQHKNQIHKYEKQN